LYLPDVVWHRLRSETDHELRAALICLLTAGLAARGTAAIIGEAKGGWFWLPPWSLWQSWATEGLENAAKRIALRATCVLIDRSR
jgi:integral membrane sensor domain MASE1